MAASNVICLREIEINKFKPNYQLLKLQLLKLPLKVNVYRVQFLVRKLLVKHT